MDKIIKWSPKAVECLEDICNYISKDSVYYASLFAQRILFVIENIPQFPKSGRIVPEYNNENIREKIYYNYRIVYRIKKDIIEVIAITHSARQLKSVIEKI